MPAEHKYDWAAIARFYENGHSIRGCQRRFGFSNGAHHVNGDGLDNRLRNLRLLCPNCHSHTENWGGRGKGVRPEAR